MKILGFEITLRKALPTPLHSVASGTGGWWPVVREPFTGAWQRNMELRSDQILTHSTLFSVRALISSDVSKLRLKLVAKNASGIWEEVEIPAYSPVLRRPNRYQTRMQFFACWVDSKLIHGNTYVLKERDNRNVVVGMHVLNPALVTVLVAPDGAVFYELQSDTLAGMPRERSIIPASEIIHDLWNAYNHPLVGISPILACGLAATHGINIQNNSTRFFESGSRPSGVVTVPTDISAEKAREIAAIWDSRPPGSTAVLKGGAQYVPLTMSAVDAQLIEQLQLTSEIIAGVFHVPKHMVGVGDPPSYNNIESLNQMYYSQCLQVLIENIEELLDQGLGLGPRFGNTYGTEFDLDGLLRMDTATKVKAAADGVKAGFMSPNEARFQFDLPPVTGGESPYLQQQNYSLAALDRRDSAEDPVTPGIAPPQEANSDDDGGDEARAFYATDLIRRSRAHYVPGPA